MKISQLRSFTSYRNTKFWSEALVVLDTEHMYTAELSAPAARRRFVVAPRKVASSSMFSTTGVLALELSQGETLDTETQDAIRAMLDAGDIVGAVRRAERHGRITLSNPRHLEEIV